MDKNMYSYIKSQLKNGVSYDDILEAFANGLDEVQAQEEKAAIREENIYAARSVLASGAKAYMQALGTTVDDDFESAMMRELENLEKGRAFRMLFKY